MEGGVGGGGGGGGGGGRGTNIFIYFESILAYCMETAVIPFFYWNTRIGLKTTISYAVMLYNSKTSQGYRITL